MKWIVEQILLSTTKYIVGCLISMFPNEIKYLDERLEVTGTIPWVLVNVETPETGQW